MQETIISNSSPIIHLAKIDQLDLLRDFFGELLIQEAVYEECMTQGKGRFEVARIKQVSWLRVFQVTNQHLVKLLNSEKMSFSKELRVMLPMAALAILENGYDH